MPNKRKTGKKKLTFWLTEGELELVDNIATERGLNRTDTIRNLITMYASQRSAAPKGKTHTKGTAK